MPRNHQLAASTLRNRNRVTNKTRLKIHRGTLDADALFIPDEDEEKHHFTTLVAGVDAEDANEHHLQQVLSAAHRSHARTTADTTTSSNTQAFIPTPDCTGVIDNYEELYPPNKWLDPHSFVCTSQTVEDSVSNGIAEGFTYYMDERDKEWLDKHNEEARGEGTSAQGAMLASGTTRTSSRSAKAKGKEPESVHTAAITEDEFELVMGIFEKVTHDTTEYLHHGLENGMTFPEFAEYQEAFSQPLKPELFSSYVVPSWIPQPPVLLQLARAIYPHWKERRLDRKGHRIIPVLNFDEADTLNESYVCFRRRDTKAIRKTRAQQASSSDKLIRLQAELQATLDLAKLVMNRETQKKECIAQSLDIWQKRMAFADLKRKYPSLKDKIDDELLVDKERPVKKPEAPTRITGLKLKTADAPPVPVRQEVQIRPSDRIKSIRNRVEAHLDKQREKDHHWEDQVDNPYQNLPVPYSSKLFKFITPPGSPRSSSPDDLDTPPSTRNPRAARLRYGRGGRLHVDRREFKKPRLNSLPRSALFGVGPESDDDVKMEVDDKIPEDPELFQQLESRWKFDNDDGPPYGPQGADEENRVLVDDYNVDYLMHTADLFEERDHVSLVTDSNIFFHGPDGKPMPVHAFRLGLPPLLRKDANGVLRPISGLPNSIIPPQVLPVYPFPPSTHNMSVPVSMPHQMKPPAAAPQMRISSNGGMRPSSTTTSNGTPIHTQTPQPIPVPVPVPGTANGNGGSSRPALAMPHIDIPKQDPLPTPAIQQNGILHTSQPEPAVDAVTVNVQSPTPVPVRPKPQIQMTPQQHIGLGVPTNGYHLTPMPMTSATLVNTGFPQLSGAGLTPQQMQNLKTVFANMPNPNDPANRALLASYMHLAPNAAALNMAMTPGSMKLPPGARPMQWPMAAALPRPPSVANGVDAQSNGTVVTGVPNGSVPQAVPIRSPSTNGTRRNGIQINGQHAMSPHLQQAAAVTVASPNLAHAASPPRMTVTPKMQMASPSG